MAAVLASVLALVVVVVGAVAYAAHRAANAAEARRDEIAEELRTARRELRIALAELTTARHKAAVLRRQLTAQAALTPDATSDAGPELPALDLTTLRQVWACTPADFDTPGDAR
ncbi:hypothetical protein [Micromonospora sp. HUAS LYJ1]|uniref:hypothetical protein n=1 Tax=Micromonospora sp. HUAS LYJ1 TaxID=3061626 RepID=UPI00267103D4|nr:hypothetical protein [Micromonospora sp. HUAS LYJ1]WKU07977.1 hypothetical protein Q2K16_13590 [Micromonospora sp. HUAS LYJ1]